VETSLTTVAPTLPDTTPPTRDARPQKAAHPLHPAPAAHRPTRVPAQLTRRQKAAVVVQFLLKEGDSLPLECLPDAVQAALTSELGGMRLVNRSTLNAVIAEFVHELEEIGLTFPGDIEGALGALDGHISPVTAARLRREAGVAERGDPWERVAALSTDRLMKVLEDESTEVGAVMLSKLPVAQSADLLGLLPGDRARELSYAISRTGRVLPETVRRIGLSLVSQLDSEPVRAFSIAPEERIGAILNVSRATIRDSVLAGLDETDAGLAADIRRTIFTFAHIPERISPRDIPRIARGVDQADLVIALTYAGQDPQLTAARDYILDNMSKRLVDTLREEMAEKAAIRERDGEPALNALIGEIRRMLDAGELRLIEED
jgi:flagellar motor switch protein FliG